MVSFGSNGFEWSSAAEKLETKDKSVFDGVNYFFNKISLNYAYLLDHRFQLGGFASVSRDEYTFYNEQGKNSSSEIKNTKYGLFVLYNFSDEIMDAIYAGVGVSQFNYEEQNSQDLQTYEGSDPFELDDSGTMYEIVLGKRFSLTRWHIDHLTYSPQLSYFRRSHGKDFNEQKIGNGTGFSLYLIKFDFFF